MESVQGSEQRSWRDDTGGVSKFEIKDFSDNHNWTKGVITIKGHKKSQEVNFKIKTDKYVILEESMTLKKDEVRTFNFNVGGRVKIHVSGSVKKRKIFYGAGAIVNITLNYNDLAVDNWMQDTLSTIGNKTLRDICIPGSHDSGMSIKEAGTVGAREDNVITQFYNIGKQLEFGTRYFDVRPVITGGGYRTGHYSSTDGTSLGANGESIDDIINEINNFTKNRKELIILNLSHACNTDKGFGSYSSFTKDEWIRLFDKLKKIKNRYVSNEIDLTKIHLNKMISKKSAVIIVVESGEASSLIENYKNEGFYTYSAVNAYNSYSDSNDVNVMIKDQLSKMKEKSNSRYFLLSWTLTQSKSQAVLAKPSILSLAIKANNCLESKLMPTVNKTCFPNIIYTDNIIGNEVAVLSMRINEMVK